MNTKKNLLNGGSVRYLPDISYLFLLGKHVFFLLILAFFIFSYQETIITFFYLALLCIQYLIFP